MDSGKQMTELFLFISSICIQGSSGLFYEKVGPYWAEFGKVDPEEKLCIQMVDTSNSSFTLRSGQTVYRVVPVEVSACDLIGRHDPLLRPCFSAVNPPCKGHWYCRICRKELKTKKINLSQEKEVFEDGSDIPWGWGSSDQLWPHPPQGGVIKGWGDK